MMAALLLGVTAGMYGHAIASQQSLAACDGQLQLVWLVAATGQALVGNFTLGTTNAPKINFPEYTHRVILFFAYSYR